MKLLTKCGCPEIFQFGSAGILVSIRFCSFQRVKNIKIMQKVVCSLVSGTLVGEKIHCSIEECSFSVLSIELLVKDDILELAPT